MMDEFLLGVSEMAKALEPMAAVLVVSLVVISYHAWKSYRRSIKLMKGNRPSLKGGFITYVKTYRERKKRAERRLEKRERKNRKGNQ